MDTLAIWVIAVLGILCCILLYHVRMLMDEVKSLHRQTREMFADMEDMRKERCRHRMEDRMDKGTRTIMMSSIPVPGPFPKDV